MPRYSFLSSIFSLKGVIDFGSLSVLMMWFPEWLDLEWKYTHPPTPPSYRQFSFPGKTTWDKKNPTRKLSAYGISMLTVTKLWMKCQLTVDDLRDFCSSYISQPNKTHYNWITKQEKNKQKCGLQKSVETLLIELGSLP